MKTLAVALLLLQWSCVFWSETFESAGTDGNYSDGADITPGNWLDPDAPVPSSYPSTWGSEMGRVHVGTNVADGAAHLRHVLDTPTTDGFYTRVETILEIPTLDEGAVTVMVAKPSGDPLGPVACWRLYYLSSRGRNYFWLSVGNFAKNYFYPPEGLEIGTNYVHWVGYDLSRGFVWWRVNGKTVFLDAIPATYCQDIGTIVLGSSGSSSGRGMTYAIDNYVVLDAR